MKFYFFCLVNFVGRVSCKFTGSEFHNAPVTGRGGRNAGDVEWFVALGSCYFSHYLQLSVHNP